MCEIIVEVVRRLRVNELFDVARLHYESLVVHLS